MLDFHADFSFLQQTCASGQGPPRNLSEDGADCSEGEGESGACVRAPPITKQVRVRCTSVFSEDAR